MATHNVTNLEDAMTTITELERHAAIDKETITTMQKQIDRLMEQNLHFETKASELEEVAQRCVKEHGFAKASTQLPSIECVWIQAKDAVNIFLALRKAVDIANRQPKFKDADQQARKIVFQYEAASGEVKGARLEDV